MDLNCRYHFDHESKIKSNCSDIKALETKVVEMDKRMLELDGYNREAHSKIKAIENKTDHIERLTFVLEDMQKTLTEMVSKVGVLGEKVAKIENAPGQKALSVVKYIVVAIGGYYLNRLLNGGL